MCSFGTAPGTLLILPQKKVMTTMPAATITDNIPMLNVMPFAMCISPSNPAVSAALMVPQPCVPVTASPWMPGSSTCIIGGIPALESNSKLMCNWGGVIQVVNPGQTKTIINK